MSRHIEWVNADCCNPTLISPDLVEEESYDGNEERYWGLWVGEGEDGAMLYGTLEHIKQGLEDALEQVEKALDEVPTPPFCQAVNPGGFGLSCTRTKDHAGDHIAHLHSDGLEGERWSQ